MSNYNEEIRIEDVIRLLNIPYTPPKSGKEIYFSCPNCGGGNTACSANTRKNSFFCFKCDRGGGPVELYMDETGFCGTKKEAKERLKEELDCGYCHEVTPRVFPEQEETEDAKLADREAINATYRTMLAMLPLQKAHKEDLLRRGLTESEIEEGLFASMPLDRTAICRKLIRAGCHLEGVPGFFVNKYGNWELYGRPGYCCPAIQDSFIAGIQIRADVPIKNCKYVWLSSSGKEKGCSSGSPVAFYGDPNAEKVVVTEGLLKAYVTYCFLDKKQAVMGIPGVSLAKSSISVFKAHNHRIVWESYDMDKCMPVANEKERQKKETLTRARNKLRSCCEDLGLIVVPCYWDRDTKTGLWKGNYKGIDDYLAVTRRGL